MGNKFKEQIKVVSRDALRPHVSTMEASFFTEDGDPLVLGFTPASAVTDITTLDGSDAATTQALANATKTKVNEILSALRSADLML